MYRTRSSSTTTYRRIVGIIFIGVYIGFTRDDVNFSIGKSGRKGIAINFVTEEDARQVKDIEQFYNTVIEEMPENIADLLWR